ncbi:MAG TPA: DUF4388 domain-containing protein [Thermoanaerobaculia bacterium]|nr:DUF4388 domain-containing protein [Thermoanaerobaculia bacterium]
MATFQGDLSTFGFPDLLQWMELNQRSGRLTIVRRNDRRVIDWMEGEIVYVSGSLPRNRLAVFLHREKVLSASTLHTLLARNFTTADTNLTRLILDEGHATLSQFSRRVDDLARRLLFEIFEWKEGRFEYDPTSRVERILRIRLKVPAQALAFQAVKALDEAHHESSRVRAAEDEPRDGAGDGDPEFWDLVERAGLSLDPREGRRRQSDSREFTRKLRNRLARFNKLRPVHENTAALLRQLAAREKLDPASVAPTAAIDPSLTLDLLILANSLVVERRSSVLTALDALERLGPAATAALAERLSAPDFPPVPATDVGEAAIRRASLAAAIAARRLAGKSSIAPERAYALGLLHAVPYADLIAVSGELEIPPGPFRSALLEAHRPLVGRLRAEAWSLPPDLESVLSDPASDSPASALVGAARATLPDCALGPLPAAAGSARASRAAATELNRLFEALGLPPARSKHSTTHVQ